MLRNPVALLAAVCVVTSLAAPGWAIPPESPICGPVFCRYWLHSQEPALDGVDEFGGEADLALDLSEFGGEADLALVDLALDLSVVALWELADDPDLGPNEPAQEPGEGVSLAPMPPPLPLTTVSAIVPEPSTAALTATGLLGLVAYARRRKRR